MHRSSQATKHNIVQSSHSGVASRRLLSSVGPALRLAGVSIANLCPALEYNTTITQLDVSDNRYGVGLEDSVI